MERVASAQRCAMNSIGEFVREEAGAPWATAVIVLYGMTAEESPAFWSLLEARARLDASQARIPIVLWDNNPVATEPQRLPDEVKYLHDASNAGLADAYNEALKTAIRNGSRWLITLDQDTRVPGDYLERLAAAARECESCPGVGAIVPQIAVGAKRLSPYQFSLGSFPRWLPLGYCGLPNDPVFAFNSGAMINVATLRQVGGYDRRFPVDCSDHALFHSLARYGKRAYVDGSIQLDHEFSMVDMNRRMTQERYSGVLMAESAFWDLHMGWFAGTERTLRLLGRFVRQRIRRDRTELSEVTWEFVKRRLVLTKTQRIAIWNAEQEHRGFTCVARYARPRVSVCMAAFNGAQFVEEQMRSILPQLQAEDEVVVIDDSSRDDTVARIRNFRDDRIRIITHTKNEGVVAAFEDALREARGEVLFLCDDDDLWASNKVQRILQVFRDHPEAQVAISRAELIDEHGNRQPDSRMNRFGKFAPGFWRNVFKNHYQGSAMAIRASLLGEILPLPRGKSFLHDAWIGTRNEAAGGKVAFVDEPLLYYRRHSGNANQVHPLSVKIRLRAQLLMAHLSYAFQFKASTSQPPRRAA